ncbi:unnamed protein product [Auanema sp. JU1783]|nr:unnamed protein product [Auanema sp. JU1783]
MGDNLVYAIRGSTGFSLRRGLTNSTALFEDKESPKQNPCELFAFSNAGHLFAYCDTQRTRVIEPSTGKEILSLDLKRTKAFSFSPKDTYLFTYEQYAIYGRKTHDDQKPEPNLRVYHLKEKKHVTTLIAAKESTWQPQWSDDESICIRQQGSELCIYKNGNLNRYEDKLAVPNLGNFALSPGNGPLYIACYVNGHGANPARVQVRKVGTDFPIVANKTFFKSDKAELVWNQKGTALLIKASVDVDKSNQSYYGEQSVFMINVVTDESFIVPLAKKGPVYSAEWNPNGKDFAVVYGFMPSKLTVYNHRGEPIFDAAEGPRNEVHYNAFGNILLACGFGNLAKGMMEFWDIEKKKLINTIDVPNTTQFQWAPDGQHFVTATTTPRLRIDNCYRLWHYSGKLISEFEYESPKEELWQVMFRPMLGYNKFEVKELTKLEKMQAGLLIKKKDASHPLNNLPAGAVRQAGAYVPPHLRGKPSAGAPDASKGKVASAVKPSMSETERKVFNLNKKLQEIEKLKEKMAKGENLQKNQLDKINTEKQIVEELKLFKIS